MTWLPTEADVDEILALHPQPLMALVDGETPAVVLRGAYEPVDCEALMKRFRERELLYDPRHNGDGRPRRVDIGTSFGSHRADREKFHAHSTQTHELFSTLFEGYVDPVKVVYEKLAALAPNKTVLTAREKDGRLYGPAIFRIYHEDLGHGPHYDSVRKRSKSFEYEVAHFDHQFAAVLCLQNSDDVGDSGEPTLYNCPWTPRLQQTIEGTTFADHAEAHAIERVQIHLEPGDLYFFFSENYHEVPAVCGDRPRAVLAIFFAMSPDRDEIYVWS